MHGLIFQRLQLAVTEHKEQALTASALLSKRRYKVKELASFCDVSERAIHSWRKGRVIPRFYNLQRLCKFFEVSFEEMIKNYCERGLKI